MTSIVSLTPHATEILFELGLGSHVVGCTHRCDYPLEALSCRRVTQMSDDQHGFEVSEDLLDDLQPNLIFFREGTDDLNITLEELEAFTVKIESQPQVVPLQPSTIGEALGDIRTIAQATNQKDEAVDLVQSLANRVDQARLKVRRFHKPAVTVLQSLDPLTVAGLWIPQLVEYAGGEYLLNFAGEQNQQVDWQMLQAAAPEMIFLLGDAASNQPATEMTAGFEKQFAQIKPNIVAMFDGKRFMAEPGPRIIDGLELLTEFLHKPTEHSEIEIIR